MTLLENIVQSWGAAGLVGVGVGLTAPALFSAIGITVRPLAKELIKGYFTVRDTLYNRGYQPARELTRSTVAAEAKTSIEDRARKRERARTAQVKSDTKNDAPKKARTRTREQSKKKSLSSAQVKRNRNPEN